MLRSCFLKGLRRRVAGAIRLDRPTQQQQAQNDTENQLFLSGQAAHAPEYSGDRGGSQWRNGLAVFDRVPFLHPPGNPILRFGAWDFSGAWILELGAFIFPGIPLGPIP